MYALLQKYFGKTRLTGFVIPAHAGIQSVEHWIPASAGMTSNMKLNHETSAAVPTMPDTNVHHRSKF